MFLGYPFGKKGWRLYDLEKNEFFISRDVRFLEDIFPYATQLPNEASVENKTKYADLHFGVHDRFTDSSSSSLSPTQTMSEDKGDFKNCPLLVQHLFILDVLVK